SLFGASDWNSLLTQRLGFYEPGAFDTRFEPPRPTVIAAAASGLARSAAFDHPALDRPGWWRAETSATKPSSRHIVLTGSGGMAGVVADCCAGRRLAAFEAGQVGDAAAGEPWAVVEVESGFGGVREHGRKARPLRLTCRYAEKGEGGSLVVEAAHSFDPVHVVNAFLDLMIDGAAGRFRLTRADACGQYACEADSRAERQPAELKRRAV
ncbi:MAG: hypothetical protein H0T56_03540, partial [Pseudaminobacter sp.]|nr:hypothetical protein [Pseudaminobacter sp.]